ncbi:TPA: recombinase family protein [Klebsiella aerogenes]|nr:recombinase family protein [Klebsiella aerogenes]
MTTFIYVRCSTDDKDQNPITQVHQILKKYPAKFYFLDYGKSGALPVEERPALNRIVNLAQKGDTIVVNDWTRLSRDVAIGSAFCKAMMKKGVKLVSVRDNYDLSTPSGMMMFNVSLSIAQHERESITIRIKEGLERAKAEGKQLGKPISPAGAKARQMLSEGFSVQEVMNATGLKRAMVYRLRKETA